MKLIIRKDINTNQGYYIVLQYPKETMIDKNIAEILDIPLETYINILKQYNANNLYYHEDYYFKIKEDAEKAIKKLTPYLVMATLTE